MPDWKDIPEGYYAVLDPLNAGEMTYWRKKVRKRGGQSFGPWPQKARYGPTLTRKDLPEGVSERSEEGQAFIRDWYENVSRLYKDAIVAAIVEDPVIAGQRFADWAIRCCCCGKGLTNDRSKVYGIGPECRKGMPGEVLANYFRAEVGKAHAAHLLDA